MLCYDSRDSHGTFMGIRHKKDNMNERNIQHIFIETKKKNMYRGIKGKLLWFTNRKRDIP